MSTPMFFRTEPDDEGEGFHFEYHGSLLVSVYAVVFGEAGALALTEVDMFTLSDELTGYRELLWHCRDYLRGAESELAEEGELARVEGDRR